MRENNPSMPARWSPFLAVGSHIARVPLTQHYGLASRAGKRGAGEVELVAGGGIHRSVDLGIGSRDPEDRAPTSRNDFVFIGLLDNLQF